MLVAVDAAGFLILLGVESFAVLGREVAVILGFHAALFAVDAGFLVLKVVGLAGGDLAAFDAVGDAVLLAGFALGDGRAGGRCACGLGEEGGGGSRFVVAWVLLRPLTGVLDTRVVAVLRMRRNVYFAVIRQLFPGFRVS